MLHDPMLVDEVNKLIAEDRINAEWAVRRVARKIKHLFDNIPDEYFRERRADVDFVADRVVRNLIGQVVDVEVEVPDGRDRRRARPVAGGRGDAGADAGGWRPSSPTWAARPATPRSWRGRARRRRWWARAGPASRSRPGDLVAVDGSRGLVLVNPTAGAARALPRDDAAAPGQREASALQTADLPAVTTDGFRVRLNGNIEFLEEIPSLLRARRRGHRPVPHRVPLPGPARARPPRRSTTAPTGRCWRRWAGGR